MRTALLQHEHDASQSGHETQPSSRYTVCGLDGMLEGRFPALLHALYSFWLFRWSFRTIALAADMLSIVLSFQSGQEIQPSSRYTVCGLDGMLEGRFPALLHALYSFWPFSFSFRTIALAAAKGRKAPRPPSLPSQFCHEIQPSSRYTVCGLDGMLEGRFNVLRHASHCLVFPSLSFRTIALAAANESILKSGKRASARPY